MVENCAFQGSLLALTMVTCASARSSLYICESKPNYTCNEHEIQILETGFRVFCHCDEFETFPNSFSKRSQSASSSSPGFGCVNPSCNAVVPVAAVAVAAAKIKILSIHYRAKDKIEHTRHHHDNMLIIYFFTFVWFEWKCSTGPFAPFHYIISRIRPSTLYTLKKNRF